MYGEQDKGIWSFVTSWKDVGLVQLSVCTDSNESITESTDEVFSRLRWTQTLSLPLGLFCRATDYCGRFAWRRWLAAATDDEHISFDERSAAARRDETVLFQKSRKQRGWRARDAVTAARRYADIEVMFWLARARPYQRTKRREPPGARDDPIGGGVLVGWPGGAVELWSENGTEPSTRYSRGFLKRRRYVRSLVGGGGDGHGPDAGGAGVCGTPCLAVALHLPWEIVGDDDETPVNGQPRWRWRCGDRVPYRRRRWVWLGGHTALWTGYGRNARQDASVQSAINNTEPNRIVRNTRTRTQAHTHTHAHTRARWLCGGGGNAYADNTLHCLMGKVVAAPANTPGRRRFYVVVKLFRSLVIRRWTRVIFRDSAAAAVEPLFTRTDCAEGVGGRVLRGGESKRSVCVCRRWRGATNRVAAAVCRCRCPANGGQAARRQSAFKPFPAHREQLLGSTPEPRCVDRLSPPPGWRPPPRREARQKSDSSACCNTTHGQARARMRSRRFIYIL